MRTRSRATAYGDMGMRSGAHRANADGSGHKKSKKEEGVTGATTAAHATTAVPRLEVVQSSPTSAVDERAVYSCPSPTVSVVMDVSVTNKLVPEKYGKGFSLWILDEEHEGTRIYVPAEEGKMDWSVTPWCVEEGCPNVVWILRYSDESKKNYTIAAHFSQTDMSFENACEAVNRALRVRGGYLLPQHYMLSVHVDGRQHALNLNKEIRLKDIIRFLGEGSGEHLFVRCILC